MTKVLRPGGVCHGAEREGAGSLPGWPTRSAVVHGAAMSWIQPILVAGPPRTATSWTAKALSRSTLVRYLREPIFQGKPTGWDRELDNLYLEAGDTHEPVLRAWREALSLRTRLRKRWLYSESSVLLRRLPVLPARLLVKEVNASLSLTWLERQFGFRVAVTLRHPCGFWASAMGLKDMGHITLSLDGLLRQRRLMDRYFSDRRTWLESVRDDKDKLLAAYCMILKVLETQALANPSWIICRHEALCAQPQQEFERVFAGLGLTLTRSARDFITSSSAESDGLTYGLKRNSALEADKWRQQLSEAQLSRAGEIMDALGVRSYVMAEGSAAAQ